MSYVKTNVLKPSAAMPGNGGNLKDKIVVFDWDDVTGGYQRDASGIQMDGPLVFSSGAYAVQIYATQDTIKCSAESQGDTDAEGVIQTVEFTHPGNSREIKEFRNNWLGRSVGIMVEKCSDGSKTLYGAPCSALRLAFKSEHDKDKNNATFTFKSGQKGPDIAEYGGTITLDDVKGTAAADATTVNVAAGQGEYQLTDGVAASAIITALTNPTDGFTYTLLGSGGDHPSIIQGNSFILHEGTVWNAIAGSRITFRAFKDGEATYKFIEVSRI
ncbi:MAG: hypothetical protein AB9842_08250 [Bacteroidales bacterium]